MGVSRETVLRPATPDRRVRARECQSVHLISREGTRLALRSPVVSRGTMQDCGRSKVATGAALGFIAIALPEPSKKGRQKTADPAPRVSPSRNAAASARALGLIPIELPEASSIGTPETGNAAASARSGAAPGFIAIELPEASKKDRQEPANPAPSARSGAAPGFIAIELPEASKKDRQEPANPVPSARSGGAPSFIPIELPEASKKDRQEPANPASRVPEARYRFSWGHRNRATRGFEEGPLRAGPSRNAGSSARTRAVSFHVKQTPDYRTSSRLAQVARCSVISSISTSVATSAARSHFRPSTESPRWQAIHPLVSR